MEWEAQGKDEERQEEEVTEELKRLTAQEMSRGSCLSEEALLVFGAKDPAVEGYTKVTTAFKSAIRAAVPDSLPATPKSPPTRRVPSRGTPRVPAPLHG